MKLSDLTIVLPVYGCSIYLNEALRSIEDLIAQGATLLVVDDGIHFEAQVQLNNWMSAHNSDRISLKINHQNLGLFKSLNQNLTFVETKWFCFCCSDDLFLSDAASKLQQLKVEKHISLILSKFLSINPDSSLRHDDSRELVYLAKKFGNILRSHQMLPALLRYGSLNGNLTGMIINTAFWNSTDGFISDWKHAADWEWLVRACNFCTIQINDQCLVAVRTHENQLSALNQQNGLVESEAVEVIKELRDQPINQQSYLSVWWAGCLLQHHLWNILFKNSFNVSLLCSLRRIKVLTKAAPFVVIFLAMLASLPSRILRRAGMLLAWSTDRSPY